MSTYNGWTNYETWRVNLEIFDPLTLGDFWGYENADPKTVDSYELAEIIKDYAHELIEESSGEGIARDYATAFLSSVNWREIALCMIENAKSEMGA